MSLYGQNCFILLATSSRGKKHLKINKTKSTDSGKQTMHWEKTIIPHENFQK